MKKILLVLAVYCFCAVLNQAFAQDKIYLENEVKEGTVTEITDDKISFKDAQNPASVITLPRKAVKLIFKKNGEFISVSQLENSATAAKTIEDFLHPASQKTFTVDRIYTVYNKLITASVYKEDDVYVYYKNTDEDDRLAKTSIAAIVYKNGTHKVISNYGSAALVLGETNATFASTDFTEQKIEPIKAVVKKEVVPEPAKQETKTETIVQDAVKKEEVPEKKMEPPVVKTEEQPVKADLALEKKISDPEKKAEPPVVNKNIADPEVKTAPEKTEPVIKKEEPAKKTTALLMIVAPKNNSIMAALNNAEPFVVKSGTSKIIELPAGNYKVIMDDKLGNVVEKPVTISTEQMGETVSVAFPEIDYAAQIEKFKQEQLVVLKSLESTIATEQKACALVRESLSKDSLQVLRGEKPLDNISEALAQSYDNCKSKLQSLVANYNTTATESELKEQAKPTYTRLLKEANSLPPVVYIQSILSGKKPMSANLAIALQQSRASDLKFFIKKDSVNEMRIGGYSLLSYALKNNADPTVVQALVAQGASVNNFSKRFEDNTKVYETPLTLAAMNKNAGNIKVLIDAGAKLYPPFAQNKDKRQQVKYVMPYIKGNKNIIDLFETAGMNMTDYDAELKKAVDAIVANMVSIDTGSFTIGCIPDVRVSCLASEQPAAKVSLSKFAISKFEVTRSQWAVIMEEENVAGVKECPDCPISMISFEMAQNFIAKLNEISGKKFRLPTEAEWEFAAGGGTKSTQRNKFSGSDDAAEVAWTSENTDKLHAVGEKKPNALGLYDMSGNVAEWCSSWFSENYYMRITPQDPQGPEQGSTKVLRGGSWMQSSFSARTTRRWGEMTGFLNQGVGFRLAMD